MFTAESNAHDIHSGAGRMCEHLRCLAYCPIVKQSIFLVLRTMFILREPLREACSIEAVHVTKIPRGIWTGIGFRRCACESKWVPVRIVLYTGVSAIVSCIGPTITFVYISVRPKLMPFVTGVQTPQTKAYTVALDCSKKSQRTNSLNNWRSHCYPGIASALARSRCVWLTSV